MPLTIFFTRATGPGSEKLESWDPSTSAFGSLVGDSGSSSLGPIADLFVVKGSEVGGRDRLFIDAARPGLWTSDGTDRGTVQIAPELMEDVEIWGASVVRQAGGRTIYDVYVTPFGDWRWEDLRVGVVRSDAVSDADRSNDLSSFMLSGPANSFINGPFIPADGGHYVYLGFFGGTLQWIAPGGQGAVVASGISGRDYAVDGAGEQLFFVKGGQLYTARGTVTERITTDTAAYRWTLANGGGIVDAVGDGGVIFAGTRIDLDPNDGTEWSGTGLWSYASGVGFRDLLADDSLTDVDVDFVASRGLEGDDKPLVFRDTWGDLWRTDGTPAGTRLIDADLWVPDVRSGFAWGDVLFVEGYNSGVSGTYRIEGDTAEFFLPGTMFEGKEIDGYFYFIQQPDGGVSSLYCIAPDGDIELIATNVGRSILVGANVAPNPIATIAGTNGNDVLTGTARREQINGSGGDDILLGSPGGDTLDGGAGRDTVDYTRSPKADPNDPESIAGTGVYVALPDRGGGQHATGDRYISIENVIGSRFRDEIYGDGAANRFDGRGGADHLSGGGGDDTLVGSGADAGWDLLDGGNGNDVYILDGEEHTILEGRQLGSGIDRILTSVSYKLPTSLEIEELAAFDRASKAPLALTGNDLSNTIVGNAGSNELNGGTGADHLRGGGGRDTLVGDGADAEWDRLDGGNGNDTYIVDSRRHAIVEGQQSDSGADRILTSVSYKLPTGLAIEELAALDPASKDWLALTGNDLSNVIVGNAGRNKLHPGLDGSGRADGLRDVMRGLGGDDSYTVLDEFDTVVEGVRGSGGVDVIAASVSFDLAGPQVRGSVEHLLLESDADLSGDGNEFGNIIVGNPGDNRLSGGAGSDTLVGDAGNDTITGGAGRDLIAGQAGDDRLNGGKNRDVFTFSVGSDTIEGFEDSEENRSRYDGLDRIDLQILRDANGGQPLTMDDLLISTKRRGVTIEIDLNGDAIADQFDSNRDGRGELAAFYIVGRTPLGAEDFLF